MFINALTLILFFIFIFVVLGCLIFIIYRDQKEIKRIQRGLNTVNQTTQTILKESDIDYREKTDLLLNKVKSLIKQALNKQREELEEKYFDREAETPLLAKQTVEQLEKEILLLSTFDNKPPNIRMAILNDILSRYDENALKILFGFDVREKKKNLFYDKERLDKFLKK